MAIAFPATLVNLTGNIVQHKVTFVIEKENAQALSEIAIDGIGKQYLVIAYEIGKDTNLIEELKTNRDSGRAALMKQLHALIYKIAEDSKVDGIIVKDALRRRLITSQLIESSTSELDEQGAAQAIFLLQTSLSVNNFDYDNYAKTRH